MTRLLVLQEITWPVQEHLGIEGLQNIVVPLHVHLGSITLPDIKKGGKWGTQPAAPISVRPPPVFMFTLNALNLGKGVEEIAHWWETDTDNNKAENNDRNGEDKPQSVLSQVVEKQESQGSVGRQTESQQSEAASSEQLREERES